MASVLHSGVRPFEICIVDNGGGFDESMFRGDRDCRVQVIKPRRNLGVAGSWNLIHSLYAPADVVYLNDDIVLGPRSLEALLSTEGGFVIGHVWSCFLQREEIWRAVGEYDDGFWPAYYEDNDYHYRMRLANFDYVSSSRPSEVWHAGSATGGIGAGRFGWNEHRYRLKWGGSPGGETFTQPWNGIAHDELDFYYQRACDFSSDINEHCATLKRLALECAHVTVFGAGNGIATTALLAAKPRHLVAYDTYRIPEFDNVIRLAELPQSRTRFELHVKNAIEFEIEPTELLFIDSFHIAPQLRAELRKNADRVGKYIVIHDTVTFAHAGEYGWEGLWQAIAEFTESGEWAVATHYENNNGLTVLRRR